jgi:hypothetical protein
MATNLSRFNEQVLNFLQEMKDLFPDDKKLTSFYHTVEFMKKTNPREIIVQFKNLVYPFKEKILVKDESFFINSDFSDSVQCYVLKTSGIVTVLVFTIRSVFGTTLKCSYT